MRTAGVHRGVHCGRKYRGFGECKKGQEEKLKKNFKAVCADFKEVTTR